jgi:hypothetical protein
MATSSSWRQSGASATGGRKISMRVLPSLVAFGEDDVYAVDAGGELGQRHFRRDFGDHGILGGRRDADDVGTGLGVAPGVLTGMVDLEAVDVVLDDGHFVAAPFHFGDLGMLVSHQLADHFQGVRPAPQVLRDLPGLRPRVFLRHGFSSFIASCWQKFWPCPNYPF